MHKMRKHGRHSHLTNRAARQFYPASKTLHEFSRFHLSTISMCWSVQEKRPEPHQLACFLLLQ